MNYKLAKQLQKAGFPSPLPPSYLYKPTLEELIAACDPYFGALYMEAVRAWTATSCIVRNGSKIPLHVCDGSTPLEAVARLWLALNHASST